MSMFDGLLDNIDDVAGRVGLPADKAQALADAIKGKLANGADPLTALRAVAQDHGLSLDRLQAMLPAGGEGLIGKATAMLDRDGDGNVMDDLQDMTKGLFGRN